MKTILHLITGLDRGGAEQMLVKLLGHASEQHSSSEKHIVVSLLDKGMYGDQIRAQGHEVFTLDMQGLPGLPHAIIKLRKIVNDVQPDAILAWMYHACLLGCFVGKTIPVIWNIRHALHDYSREKGSLKLLLKLLKYFSRKPAAIIYNSQQSLEQHQAIGYARENSLVLLNGFDTNRFYPPEGEAATGRGYYDIPEHHFVIAIFARYHPVKAFDIFMQAASELSTRRKNVFFLLAGKDVELTNPIMHALVNQYNLKDKVTLMGEIENPSSVMQLVDCVTCCSHSESFSNSIGEAMATAIPCVVTDVGEMKKVVGDTGLVVNAGDAQGLARAWETLIDMPTEQRHQLGLAARERIVNFYSIQSIYRDYSTCIDSVIQKQAHNR